MKKIISALLCMLMLLSVLAVSGCGGSSSEKKKYVPDPDLDVTQAELEEMGYTVMRNDNPMPNSTRFNIIAYKKSDDSKTYAYLIAYFNNNAEAREAYESTILERDNMMKDMPDEYDYFMDVYVEGNIGWVYTDMGYILLGI